MALIVQKFGGTSVRDKKSRMAASRHVKEAVEHGHKVIVVVSAMGRSGDPYATDSLLGLVEEEETVSTDREQDLLISCGETISAVVFAGLLRAQGVETMAFTGAQAGFKTNEDFGKAQILDMECEHLQNMLHQVDAAVVAGFQGTGAGGEITTLGRGGSDTSAAALAAALSAEYLDIFTDVDGVMTADPGIVQEASIIQTVTYDEICNLAYQGAKVIHPRAVETARHADIPIRIRSTVSGKPGTLISSGRGAGEEVQDRPVTGIAHMPGLSQITVRSRDYLTLQDTVFKEMAQAGISVDFINIQPAAIVYTVPDERAEEAVRVLQQKGYEPECLPHCTKVSAVGAGMTGIPGVAAKVVAALTKENIHIYQSADSHTTIWVLVQTDDEQKAVHALHQAFGLEQF